MLWVIIILFSTDWAMADIRTALTIITFVMFPAPTTQDAATGGKDHEIAKKIIYEQQWSQKG